MPSAKGAHILVVDDAPGTLEILKRNLKTKGYDVLTAPAVLEAIEILERTPVDLVITDIKMPGPSGQELIRFVRENLRSTEVVVITGYPSFEGVVQAVKNGAEEYLIKPFTDEELFSAVDRALGKLRIQRIGRAPAEHDRWAAYGIVGKSKQIAAVLEAAARAAQNDEPVLIQGESGTEKEFLARAIHYEGMRAGGPFVWCSGASLPAERVESELFGSGMSGARRDGRRQGLVQHASGGTLCLGEIEHASPSLQSRLAKLLQDWKAPRRSGGQPKPPRFIISTGEDLPRLVRKGSFDEDLCQSLSIQQITIPPLRERGDDAMLALQHHALRLSESWKRKRLRFSDAVLKVLWNYQWPGNAWELQRLVRHLQTTVEGELVHVPDLPSHMRFRIALRRDVGLKRTLEEVEAEHIRNVIVNEGGNRARAAEVLHIDRKTLRDKLKRYGISD